jgi:asparagine N-glycosylation enzyme membrane subunit Stt3
MKKNEINVSIDEAKSALKNIDKTEQDTNKSLRMPIWLNIIISSSFGMGVFSWASTRHENLWMLGVIISSAVYFIAVGIYLYSSRLLGVKPKVLPTRKSELKFGLITAIIFGLVVALTKVVSTGEFWWLSYVGSIFGAFALAYFLHFFPSGVYRRGLNRNV